MEQNFTFMIIEPVVLMEKNFPRGCIKNKQEFERKSVEYQVERSSELLAVLLSGSNFN